MVVCPLPDGRAGEKEDHGYMQWAHVEHAKFIQIAVHGVIGNGFKTFLAPLPDWLLNRLPSQPRREFSASELDAIGLNAAFRAAGWSIVGRRL